MTDPDLSAGTAVPTKEATLSDVVDALNDIAILLLSIDKRLARVEPKDLKPASFAEQALNAEVKGIVGQRVDTKAHVDRMRGAVLGSLSRSA